MERFRLLESLHDHRTDTKGRGDERAVKMIRSPRVAALLLALAVIPISGSSAQAAGQQTYEDPDDSRGNLDIVKISGFRLRTADHGVVYRTVLTTQDEWLDQDVDIEFYYREVGARFPSWCGDDCSGDYVGWVYFDAAQGKIRARGYEPVNCDCTSVEWPVGRSNKSSIWIDIPETYLYAGSHAIEIEFIAQSQRQAEPLPLPVCITVCRDDVGPLNFRTRRTN